MTSCRGERLKLFVKPYGNGVVLDANLTVVSVIESVSHVYGSTLGGEYG